MTAKVAVEGEVKAVKSTAFAKGADSGSWTAGEVSYKTYSNLKSGNKKVIWQAECTFSFDGKAGNTVLKTSEKVTLTAKSKKLNKSAKAVLVDGDQEVGPVEGNKLEVSAAGKLKS